MFTRQRRLHNFVGIMIIVVSFGGLSSIFNTVAAAEKVTLTLWRGALGIQFTSIWDQVISGFEEANPNINVEHTAMPWSKLREKLFTAFRFGGTLPDMVREGLNLTESYYAMGGLASLEDYVDKWEYKDVTSDDVWQSVTYGGKIYVVPVWVTPYITLYNKRMFRQAGVSPPQTWAEWIEISGKLTDVEKDQYAWAVRSDRLLQSFFVNLLWKNGGDLSENSIRSGGPGAKIAFNSNLGVRALDELVARAKFAPGGLKGNIGLKGANVVALFAKERISMLSGVIHQYGQTLAISPEMEDDIGAFIDPKGPGLNARDTNFAIGGGMIITKESRHKSEAAEFIRFFVQEKWEILRSKELGFVPLRLNIQDPSVTEHPILKVGMEAVNRGLTAQPSFPAWLEFRNTLMSEVQRVFLEQATSKQALDSAAEALTQSMQQD